MSRVFVTGASSGLGAGLARRYARPGAALGLCARREAELGRLADELRAVGATVDIYPVDVADTRGMEEAARRFLASAGGVDRVIACAGTSMRDGFREGDAAAVARLVRVNVVGVTNTLVPFVPAMVAQGGGVLAAVGSVAGFRALPGRAAYSATKAAVKTFVDGLRMDLAATGVHAMTLCPGFVRTPLTDGNPGMWFVMELDAAVDDMVDAIESKRRTYTFPWQMRALTQVLERLPEAWLRRLAPPPPRIGAGGAP